MYDVIIIGGGPAGLTAAIYASRQMLHTILLEKRVCGGMALTIDLVENLPGFPGGIKGVELAERLKEQAIGFGVEIHEFKEVKEIGISTNVKEVNKGEYSAHALIVASGGVPKRLDVPGEEEYRGRGVSYCATCDGPLFKGKDVVVVGGGDAAVSEALFLTRFVKKVTLVHRREKLRAARLLQERLLQTKKVDLVLDSEVIEILGSRSVEGVRVIHKRKEEEEEIQCNGVFIFLGLMPNTDLLKGIVELDHDGYVITDEWMRTSQDGIFACGDCRRRPLRQIVTACSDGAIAAISAIEYLANLKV